MARIVSVKSLAIDQPIIDGIKIVDPLFTPKGFARDPNPSVAPLNRLYSNLVEIAEHGQIDFPPITVKKIGNLRGQPIYGIIDGRHRLAITIGLKLPTIKVTIIG